jgi:hypothetical protein
MAAEYSESSYARGIAPPHEIFALPLSFCPSLPFSLLLQIGMCTCTASPGSNDEFATALATFSAKRVCVRKTARVACPAALQLRLIIIAIIIAIVIIGIRDRRRR